MSSLRKNHMAFRPTLGDITLEDRVVLSSTQAAHVAAASVHAAQALVTPQQLFQLHQTYSQQVQAAYTDLRNFATNQVIDAYNNAGLSPRGRLSLQQLNNLYGTISGAVDATTLRVAAQYNLLPGSNQLSTLFQDSMLGNSRYSLNNQLMAIGASRSQTASETALLQAVNRVINANLSSNYNALAPDFGVNNFNAELANAGVTAMSSSAGSVSAAAVRPAATTTTNALQQFMMNRAISQFNNNLGAFSSGIGNAALNTLYGGSATNPLTTDPTVLANFNSALNNGLGTLNFQLGSALSAVPGLNNRSQIFSGLATNFFGNGTTTNPGLVGNIGNVLTTNPNYNAFTSGIGNTFNSSFSNLASPLYSAIGQTAPLANPVTSNFSSVLNSPFSGQSFAGGFNSGFGTGFPGLGTVPSNFSNFNTGFSGLTSNFNSSLGLGVPVIA